MGKEGGKAEFTEGLTDTENGSVPTETKVLRQVESGASVEGFSQLQQGRKRKKKSPQDLLAAVHKQRAKTNSQTHGEVI